MVRLADEIYNLPISLYNTPALGQARAARTGASSDAIKRRSEQPMIEAVTA